MDGALVAREYADHLTETDIRVLLAAARQPGEPGPPAGAGPPGEPDETWLRGNPEALQALLADPRVFRVVAGGGGPGAPAAPVSPFLVFAVIVHRAAAELAAMGHVPERAGLRQRVPLFDAPELRDFLGSGARRLFLAELLASFTRIGSGRYRVQAGGGTRTRRFSELDPVRLAGLLDVAPEAERPGVYRRLGDVALFLTGVFPDYATMGALSPVDVSRLLRVAQIPLGQRAQLAATPAIDLLEILGARWYRAAWELAPVRTDRLSVVSDVAGRFRQARRVLNHVADQHLFPRSGPWFARPAS